MGLSLRAFQNASLDSDLGADLMRRLGALGPWLVRSEHRRCFASVLGTPAIGFPPAISVENCQPGGCWAVIISGHGEHSILDDGFLLPLHWETGGPHDERLPELLRRTADQVRNVLGTPHASLHLMLPGQRGPREPLFPDAGQAAGFESAFAALACGLLMLRENKPPDYRTAATARWEGRVFPVGYVGEKTRTVADFPRGERERRIENWYVPEGGNAFEAEKTLKTRERDNGSGLLAVRPLSTSQPDVLRALAPLFASSGLKPDRDADPAALQAYYQWLRATDAEQAEDYYREVLYEQICRRSLAHPGSMEPRPTHLISVVSSPSLIGLADELFRFDRILVLYTVPERATASSESHRLDYSERARQVQRLVDRGDDKCQLQPFLYRPEKIGQDLRLDVAEEMCRSIDPFLEGVDPGYAMWDTTSGLRLFSHTLEKRFARPGDWLLNLHHQWSVQTNHRIPLTESVLLWKHGESW